MWFNLSDPAVEEALYDSVAMRRFADIGLGSEAGPDETTVCKCRHVLERYGMGKAQLKAVNRYLKENGHDRHLYQGNHLRARSDIVGRKFQNPENGMRCVICRSGETRPGKVTVTLQRGDTLVVKEVPADVCRQCDEYFLDEVTSAQVLAMAEGAVKHHAEVEILRCAV